MRRRLKTRQSSLIEDNSTTPKNLRRKRSLCAAVRRLTSYAHQMLNAARARREFSNFEDRLASAMRRVPRIKDAKFPNDIPGWLTPQERQTLSALAFCLPGLILEIGSWVGLSTTALAMGIKDSGASKQFDTVDLNPPPEWFRPVGPDTIGFFPKDSLAPLGTCSLGSFNARRPTRGR
jgi:hypothetical protein